MTLSRLLIDLAGRILPPRWESWSRAMRAEFTAIPDRREALGFAFGCLWAALAIRMNVMKPITPSAAWASDWSAC